MGELERGRGWVWRGPELPPSRPGAGASLQGAQEKALGGAPQGLAGSRILSTAPVTAGRTPTADTQGVLLSQTPFRGLWTQEERHREGDLCPPAASCPTRAETNVSPGGAGALLCRPYALGCRAGTPGVGTNLKEKELL